MCLVVDFAQAGRKESGVIRDGPLAILLETTTLSI
jgi:hypothetical protein